MKRILTLILALAMTMSLSVPALAVSAKEAEASAQLLYNLNLFRGVGETNDGNIDFQLGRPATRAEAVTMLVRLLGAEDDATAKTWKTPFTDVPNWAKPYVGYAYNKGLTNGTGAKTFGSGDSVTAAQYLTFILRALGYKDGIDFMWNAPWKLTDQLEITFGEYGSTTKFLRGDAAVISERSLLATKVGTGMTLLEHLAAEGAITDSTVVIWKYGLLVFEKGFASFLFYPVKGSPATYTSFKLDAITVNGVAPVTMQLTNTQDVSGYLASIGYEVGGFGYAEARFDHDAVIANAETYTTPDGKEYPRLDFTFDYTAVQIDGTVEKDTFTASYYWE